MSFANEQVSIFRLRQLTIEMAQLVSCCRFTTDYLILEKRVHKTLNLNEIATMQLCYTTQFCFVRFNVQCFAKAFNLSELPQLLKRL